MFRNERGSVLMEFVIVLPIYMLMIGFAFVIGELALQAIHLSGGADRTYAMQPGAFDLFKKSVAPHDAREDADGGNWKDDGSWDAEHKYSYEGDPAGGTAKTSDYHTETTETHAPKNVWTEAVAAKVIDKYTLTPLSRGFVAFWFREIDNRRELMTDGAESDAGGRSALGDILDDGIGRTDMFGKDLHKRGSATEYARKYGYYSLRRSAAGRTDDRYRAWSAGAAADFWKKMVKGDSIAPSSHEDIDDGIVSADTWDVGPDKDPNPSLPDKEFDDSWTR